MSYPDGNFDTVTANRFIHHGVTHKKTPVKIIDWDYITCPTPNISTLSGKSGADGVLANGELFNMVFPGKNGQNTHNQCCILGAHTVAGRGFTVDGTIPEVDTNGTVAGLNLQGDAATADNTGLEMIIGGTQFGGHAACTIGTHALTFDATFHSADFTDQDCVSIGFRKVGQFETGHAATIAAAAGEGLYTDYVAFGIQSADDVQIATRLNGVPGDDTTAYVDSGDATGAAGNHRFRIEVTKAGVVTFSHIGGQVMDGGTLAAPSVTKAFTFDSGDVVIPYLSILSINQDSAILLKSIEVTRTPGISYSE